MIRITTLNNGLRIITEQVRDVDSVSLNIRVGVGSRAENTSQNGISHFLEHMAFKGTKSRSALDIAKTFDNIGGIFNASTGRESTSYYAKILSKDVSIGIEILTDILMNSVFPEDELEREKGVVIQEIFQTNDSPTDIIFDKYMEAAYSNQPFGRSILGTQETVKSFTRENLNDYISHHYFGANILFSAAGNVDHDTVVELAQASLSKIHSKENKQNDDAIYIGSEYLEDRKLDQVHLLIGFPTVSCYDKKYYIFQVLDSILGGGMSSRLFQEIREKQGLAYSIYSFNSSYTDTGILSIFAGTDNSNLNKLIQSITTELKKLCTHDLKEEEVERVKDRIKSQVLMSRESTSARAEILGHYYSTYGRYISKAELVENVDAVTIGDIKTAVEELLLQYNKITVAAIGKINSMPSYDKVTAMLK
jgi:predicted Zn-dependent peptidase